MSDETGLYVVLVGPPQLVAVLQEVLSRVDSRLDLAASKTTMADDGCQVSLCWFFGELSVLPVHRGRGRGRPPLLEREV